MRFDFSAAIRRLKPFCAVSFESVAHRLEPLKADYETGRLGRAEFLALVCELVGYAGSEEEFVAAWSEIFSENPPMTALVAELSRDYPLYLLSNIGDIHAEYLPRTFPVFRHFAGAVFSYRVRCAKPDPAIFELAARQFGIEPARTVFIDDLSPNVAAARTLGFRAIQYDVNDHARLLAELAALGIVRR